MILRILWRRRRFGLEIMLCGVYEFAIYIYINVLKQNPIYIYKYIEIKSNIYFIPKRKYMNFRI